MGEVAQPPFPRIAVVGLGLIGGSIAFAARRAWPSTHVVAIDREPVLQGGGRPAGDRRRRRRPRRHRRRRSDRAGGARSAEHRAAPADRRARLTLHGRHRCRGNQANDCRGRDGACRAGDVRRRASAWRRGTRRIRVRHRQPVRSPSLDLHATRRSRGSCRGPPLRLRHRPRCTALHHDRRSTRSADGAHQPSSSAGRDGLDGGRRSRG